MRFRSTACVLGGILLAGHRAGLADSQSSSLSVQVVVTRSCSISTPPAGGVAVSCSRGPIPAIQSSTSAAAAAAVTPIAQAARGTAAMVASPQQRLSAVPSVASRSEPALPAQAQAPSAGGSPNAEAGSEPIPGTAEGPFDSGSADTVRSAPLQEILTINF